MGERRIWKLAKGEKREKLKVVLNGGSPFQSPRKFLKLSIPGPYSKPIKSGFPAMGLFHKYICFKSPKMVPLCSQDEELLMQSKDKRFPEGLEL